MSQTIQEQIDAIEQSIDDLANSASGVLAYTGAKTVLDYDEKWWLTFRDFNDRVEDLDEDIVQASGHLRILDNGLLFHRH